MICLPNGVRAKAASLKCCIPNGMPMTVMQSTVPNARWERLIQMPPNRIHKMFMMRLRQAPDCGAVRTSLPNGHKANRLSFSVCSPKGMPMMVIIIPKLHATYSTAVKMPPKSNHKIFITKFMFLTVLIEA